MGGAPESAAPPPVPCSNHHAPRLSSTIAAAARAALLREIEKRERGRAASTKVGAKSPSWINAARTPGHRLGAGVRPRDKPARKLSRAAWMRADSCTQTAQPA